MSWIFAIIVIIVVAVIIFQVKTNNKVKSFVDSNEHLKGGKIFNGAFGNSIIINENGYIGLKNANMRDIKVININDISGFDVKVNGSSTVNVGNAVVGGLLFGGVGAILGGLSSRKEKIEDLKMVFNINDFNNPTININFLDGKTKKGSLVEKTMQEQIRKIGSLLEMLEKKYKDNNNEAGHN